MQNTYLLAVRCKALHAINEHAKIVCLLGGDPDANLLMAPVLPLSDVVKNDTLREIRETAIFNLSRSDEIPRQRRPPQPKSDDPLSPSKVVDAIVRSMSTQDPAGLERFAVVTDRTTESDPYILTACGCLSLLGQQVQTAEAFFVKAVDESPDCEIAWLCLMWSYMASAEWDQGLSSLWKVVRRFPASESVGRSR
jgi:hypothetical protein